MGVHVQNRGIQSDSYPHLVQQPRQQHRKTMN